MEAEPINRFEKRKQRTRAAMKTATLALVLEKGYDAVTIQDIVDRADVGRGTFYIHYADKQAVVWEIIEEGLQQAMLEGERRFHLESYPPGYLGYLMTFENAEQNLALYRLMMGSQGSALLTDRVANYLSGSIEQSIRVGEYLTEVKTPPEITAQFVTGALMRAVLWWIETENEYSAREMADMLFALVHHKE